MGEMVERIAWSMSKIYHGVDVWDVKHDSGDRDNIGRNDFREMARAAIEAIRNPTPEMYRAGIEANVGPRSTAHGYIFEAMIDAALKEDHA